MRRRAPHEGKQVARQPALYWQRFITTLVKQVGLTASPLQASHNHCLLDRAVLPACRQQWHCVAAFVVEPVVNDNVWLIVGSCAVPAAVAVVKCVVQPVGDEVMQYRLT